MSHRIQAGIRMKQFSLVVITLLALLCIQPACACDMAGEKDARPIFEDCPKAVPDVLTKAVKCQFLGGELDGEAKADKAVNAQMRSLNCDTADTELSELSKTFSNDPSISKVIRQVEQKYDLESGE